MQRIILLKKAKNLDSTAKRVKMLFDKAIEDNIDHSDLEADIKRYRLYYDFSRGRKLRNDARFIAALEDFGNKHKMQDWFVIVDIPDGVRWEVAYSTHEHQEYVVEVHREWDVDGNLRWQYEESEEDVVPEEVEAH